MGNVNFLESVDHMKVQVGIKATSTHLATILPHLIYDYQYPLQRNLTEPFPPTRRPSTLLPLLFFFIPLFTSRRP